MKNSQSKTVLKPTRIEQVPKTEKSPPGHTMDTKPKAQQDPNTIVYNIIPSPGRCTKRFLNVSDTIISLFLITPLVVAHWRGTWLFMDHHSDHFPPWHTFIFGSFLHLTLVLLRELLHHKLSVIKEERTLFRVVIKYICTKVYLYTFSMGCIMCWRGGWAVMESYFGEL